jgi:uncharacterized protein
MALEPPEGGPPAGRPPGGSAVPANVVDVPPDDGRAGVARWGLGDVLIGLGLFFASQVVAGVVVLVVVSATGSEPAGGDLWLLAVAAPVTWVVLIGWPWWVSRTKGFGRMSADFGVALRGVDLAIGAAGGLVALVAGAILATIWNVVTSTEPPTNTDILSGDPADLIGLVVALLTVAIGTPIAEEIFFRGLVLGAARKRWGTGSAVVFSSLLFGAFHVQADLVSWAFVGFVTATYGVVFAMLRVWTRGRLGAPIIAHMVVNGVAIAVVTFAG